jgi:CBS domain containing-hemolysin-like protein
MSDPSPSKKPRKGEAENKSKTTDAKNSTSQQQLLKWLRDLFSSSDGKIVNLGNGHSDKKNGHHATDEESIRTHERTLIENIRHSHDLIAQDVMTPRSDIIAVDIKSGLQDLIKILTEKPFSRLPVYRNDLDDVVGVVHIKDVMAAMLNPEAFNLSAIIRKTMIVAPSKPALDLLLEMQQSRIHMVLVVDEFGGIDGLVTIEDLVEEIVGDILDESDREPPAIISRPDGSFIADARLPLDKLEDLLPRILSEEDSNEHDTVGGLVSAVAGRVPRRGETITHESGLEFEVIDADSRRVKRVLVRKPSTINT